MRRNYKPIVSLTRFQEAQKTEQEYWKQMRETLLSEEYNRNIQKASLDIFNRIQAATDDGCLEKVLEIGGGGDPMIAYFGGSCGIAIDPLALFYKVDLLPEQLKSVVYFRGIGENLPFKDECFDGVLAYNCIDHGIAPFNILSESRRVLRNGGAIHLLVHTYSSRFVIFRNIVENIFTTYSAVDHPHYLRFKPIEKHLRRLGFVEVASYHDEHPYSSILDNSKDSGKYVLKNLLKGERSLRAFYRLERK
jgi:SAM-dependent methyltransferase